MALPEVIETYLRRHHIDAHEHTHPATYTAHQLAEVEHKPETSVVKTVFFYCDDQLIMGVLPVNRNLNLHKAKVLTHSEKVRLATEREIEKRIDALQLGAIPPFGSLFGIPVMLDESLKNARSITMPGGRTTEAIEVRMQDFLREEAPQVLALTKRPIHYKPRHETRRTDFF
ncbi:MAG: YbaK/EbsC family protein [bacterium]|nr:YbaK/EbsC family protein [bacterium]